MVRLSGKLAKNKTWVCDSGQEYMDQVERLSIHIWDGEVFRTANQMIGGYEYSNGNHSREWFSPRPWWEFTTSQDILLIEDYQDRDGERIITVYTIDAATIQEETEPVDQNSRRKGRGRRD